MAIQIVRDMGEGEYEVKRGEKVEGEEVGTLRERVDGVGKMRERGEGVGKGGKKI